MSKEIIENRRSLVRVWITYGAAAFLFLLGSAFITLLVLMGILTEDQSKSEEYFRNAKEIFFTIMPVASGIIAYWFAARKSDVNNNNDTGSQNNRNPKD